MQCSRITPSLSDRPPSCPPSLLPPLQLLLCLLTRLVTFWRCLGFCIFVCSPVGGVYYLIKSYLLTLTRDRSKTMQGGLEMLHYVTTPDGWRLALVRYPPVKRHTQPLPVLMIHGLSANRMAFDAGGQASLAKYLQGLGYDVWVVEMRGSNLSYHPQFSTNPHVRQWSVNEYIQHDIPCALSFVLSFTNAPQLHCVGHSMGGMIALCCMAERKHREKIRSCVLVGSALVYNQSGSSYEHLVPLYHAAQLCPALAELFIPHGVVNQFAALLLGKKLQHLPFYSFQCVQSNVEASTLHDLYKYMFHAIPIRLMLSLHTACSSRSGVADEDGVPYITRLAPFQSLPEILMLGGDSDVQCPPAAISNTCEHLIKAGFKVKQLMFGPKSGQQDHYGHFDLLIGKRVCTEVFPEIGAFLAHQDPMGQAQ
eukprot:NODE_1758_length_1391_cov_14.067247_g1669_i0.p1 GENE.NODE_1758_length_1391_cov_14.067247_g1669_i0~~NODE_1758_length_1391_cov_14.067247_g1669_i0.p1  ORF type:complete len:423 (-),score=94.01 NODE_1758_length_1391_cov_14.067247_g1669_i0:85-1353(-)